MSFDVYAGTVTRYYTQQWENVMQKHARETGMHYQMIRPEGANQAPPKPEEVRPAVEAWMSALSKGLEHHTGRSLQWDESEAKPYFTDRPGWQGYAALILLASYADHPELMMPKELPDNCWADDPVFQKAIERDSGTRFRQIIHAQLWLPGEYDFVFEAEDVTHERTVIGSTYELMRQLELLNAVTFKASPGQLAEYIKGENLSESQVMSDSKLGLSIFYEIAKQASTHGLPIILSF